MKSPLRVAWYRSRTTFARRWTGYLSIVLLVGLVGGLAMGAVAAGRRTQASFSAFAKATNASDLATVVSIYNPPIGLDAGYYPALVRRIAHLPGVTQAESEVGLTLLPLGANGTPLPGSEPVTYGSVDGFGFDQDRLVVAHGRSADPDNADEFIMDSATASSWGLHLGEEVTFGAYTDPQSLTTGYQNDQLRPAFRLTAKLVGVGTTGWAGVVEDQQDASNSAVVLFTPALTRRLLNCCASLTIVGLTLDGGTGSEAAVEAELARVLPKGVPSGAGTTLSVVSARAERTIRPESLALGVFGGIAALAAFIVAGQVIGRRLRSEADDLAVMRALGADPAMTVLDGLFGVLGAVVAGSVMAGVVAVALSPLAPIGPLRPYLPIGLSLDWTVLGVGLAVLVVGLSAVAVVVAYEGAPQRAALRSALPADRQSRIARAVATAGLPVAAVTGVRFALDPGAGRSSVPVRSAIVGAVLALMVVTTTFTFGASLNNLVSHPALYGWNWDYELSGQGGDLPSQIEPLLDQDHLVAEWSGVYFGELSIDGQLVPVMGGTPGAVVAPPVLSGHGLDAPDEVVLGAATLTGLHQQVGSTVVVRAAANAIPTRLRIVGTATMPAIGGIGGGGGTHLEMGSGALVPYQLIPAGERNPFDQPQPGPNAILIRVTSGTTSGALTRSVDAIIVKLGGQPGNGPVLGPQRPAEIINYRNLGSTPAILGAALAASATAALGLTLLASVRRRRRDLALLKSLGFTRSQLAATVAWQSTVAVILGVVAGVPLGIAVGRYLWDLFAREINAVPAPTVPVTSVVLIAVGALVLANLVAAAPARVAARAPTALLLRAE